MVLRDRPGKKDSGSFKSHYSSAALVIVGYSGNKYALSYLLNSDKILPPAPTAPHEPAARRLSWMEEETKASKKARPLLPPSPLRTMAIKSATDAHHYLKLPGAVLPETRESLNVH